MRRTILILISLMILNQVVEASSATEKKIIDMLIKDRSGLTYYDVPKDITKLFDLIYSQDAEQIAAMPASTLEPLVAFMKANYNKSKPWKLEGDEKISGAAIVTYFTNNIQKKLAFAYDLVIPDYLVYPGTIRYSRLLLKKSDTKKYLDIIGKATISNQIKALSFKLLESNTPNKQSGAYYSYTNTKTFVRGNVGGNQMFLSLSHLNGPSPYSERGTSVGKFEDNLYYYSKKQGLTLTGLSWVKSQIYDSKSAVVYLTLDTNLIACATFSWLSAGWEDINPTRYFHIYEILVDIMKYQNDLSNNKNVTLKALRDIVKEVDQKSIKEINAEYEKYCKYVKGKAESGKGSFYQLKMSSKLNKWYDVEALNSLELKFRKAIIEQECARILLGKPTWSKTEISTTDQIVENKNKG